MKYQEIEGNLITLAKQGKFDVIAHGCNCFCTMKRGIAPQMAKAFGCDKFDYEGTKWEGEMNKLGIIDYKVLLRQPLGDGEVVLPEETVTLDNWRKKYKYARWALAIVNMYTQYDWRGEKPFDYEAADLCFRKLNHVFKGKHIGLPQVGCGLAGGDWDVVKRMIQRRLSDCDVTIVIYNNT